MEANRTKSSTEQPVDSRVAKLVKTYAWILIVLNGFGTFGFGIGILATLSAFGDSNLHSSEPIIFPVLLFFGMMSLCICTLIASHNLLKHQNWARISIIVLSVIWFFVNPFFNIIITPYFIWFFTRPQVQHLFGVSVQSSVNRFEQMQQTLVSIIQPVQSQPAKAIGKVLVYVEKLLYSTLEEDDESRERKVILSAKGNALISAGTVFVSLESNCSLEVVNVFDNGCVAKVLFGTPKEGEVFEPKSN